MKTLSQPCEPEENVRGIERCCRAASRQEQADPLARRPQGDDGKEHRLQSEHSGGHSVGWSEENIINLIFNAYLKCLSKNIKLKWRFEYVDRQI